jgi:Zinc finger, C3HC4 type (RING finger)
VQREAAVAAAAQATQARVEDAEAAADAAQQAAAAARTEADNARQQLQELQARRRELNLPDCVVCWLVYVDTALLPCGHMCVCQRCALLPQLRDCQLCRAVIQNKNRIYVAGPDADEV